MKRQIVILTFLGIFSHAFSQDNLIWTKNFMTELKYYTSDQPKIEFLNDTVKIIGRSHSNSKGQRLQFVDYNIKGDTLKTMSYGVDSTSQDIIVDYKFDKAKNLYILQKNYYNQYQAKIVIQKYSYEGKLKWKHEIKSYDDNISYDPYAITLINDTFLFATAYKESGIITGPFVTQECIVYEFSSDGSLLWVQPLDHDYQTYCFADIIPYHGTLILFGRNTLTNCCMIKIGLDQTITTINDVELANESRTDISNVIETNDNNLLIVSLMDFRITKINLNGNRIWMAFYGTNYGSNSFGDQIKSIVQDKEGNFYVTGLHFRGDTINYELVSVDILTVKYDKNGLKIWENRYSSGAGNTIAIKNGFIYVGGQTKIGSVYNDYDYIVLRLDSITGESKGIYRYNGVDVGDDVVTDISIFDDGRVVLTGLSQINNSFNWTTQLISEVLASNTVTNKPQEIDIYPNPVQKNGIITFYNDNYKEFNITSINGETLIKGKLINHSNRLINLYNLQSGIYFLILKGDEEIRDEKIIII